MKTPTPVSAPRKTTSGTQRKRPPSLRRETAISMRPTRSEVIEVIASTVEARSPSDSEGSTREFIAMSRGTSSRVAPATAYSKPEKRQAASWPVIVERRNIVSPAVDGSPVAAGTMMSMPNEAADTSEKTARKSAVGKRLRYWERTGCSTRARDPSSGMESGLRARSDIAAQAARCPGRGRGTETTAFAGGLWP
eukprot:7382095-Prymnesium_polylepis.2